MIKSCNCKHAFQDARYGKKKRVHNKCEKGLRCTVCGNVNLGGSNYLGKGKKN